MPPSARPGNALPFLLLSAFRALIDELHVRLAEAGHGDLRPAHGMAMQMISRGGGVSDLARRLGVSKQAASKTVTTLERLGYAERRPDPRDQRQRAVALTARGVEALALSGDILNHLRDEWAAVVGPGEMDGVEEALARLGGHGSLDGIGDWLGA
ncbi:MarR family transcriptional regulator [Streptomyces sp. DSM 42041]|uniref:MarR family transcriptional regulator n=1 Tax=Streptomyces hazeniae TaxID=3075538 RepID=A0ABU2NQY6_9ACTN|nr:MarR family transcriptional regulator [Streptomyces sp. DSM 42041]MDT0378877.1 MarR family transcriptional regulator [Streptomyces sp. DSM 42041]